MNEQCKSGSAMIAPSPSKAPSNGVPAEGQAQSGLKWTPELVEERLIEAAAVWRRSKDREAHWQRLRACWPDVRHEYDYWFDYRAEGKDGAPAEQRADLKALRLPVIPPSRAEMARRDAASGWIEQHVPERDRRLVWLALVDKAAGRRPDWARILRKMGLARGKDGLRMRYARAMAGTARALNGAGVAVEAAGI